MPAFVDENELPNDRFGYRIYGVMAHLPLRQANQIRRFHRFVGALDLATEPHCSIDNFYEPSSLEEVRSALRLVAASRGSVSTDIELDDLAKGPWGAAYSLTRTADLMRLHHDVVEALMPVTRRIFDPAARYWPHTTVLLDAKPGEVDKIDAGLAKIQLERSLTFKSIELVGRVGQSRGGDYVILDSFPLIGVSSA